MPTQICVPPYLARIRDPQMRGAFQPLFPASACRDDTRLGLSSLPRRTPPAGLNQGSRRSALPSGLYPSVPRVVATQPHYAPFQPGEEKPRTAQVRELKRGVVSKPPTSAHAPACRDDTCLWTPIAAQVKAAGGFGSGKPTEHPAFRPISSDPTCRADTTHYRSNWGQDSVEDGWPGNWSSRSGTLSDPVLCCCVSLRHKPSNATQLTSRTSGSPGKQS